LVGSPWLFNAILGVDCNILLLVHAVDDLVLPAVLAVPHVDNWDSTPIGSSHKLHMVALHDHPGEVNDILSGGIQFRTVANSSQRKGGLGERKIK